MTPKQKYDERKRLRLENDLRAEQRRKDKMDRDEDMENLVVGMGTSLARIADVLELWADQQGLTMADYEAAIRNTKD